MVHNDQNSMIIQYFVDPALPTVVGASDRAIVGNSVEAGVIASDGANGDSLEATVDDSVDAGVVASDGANGDSVEAIVEDL